MPQLLPVGFGTTAFIVPGMAVPFGLMALGSSAFLMYPDYFFGSYGVPGYAPEPGKLINYVSNVAPIPIIYGTVKIGGNQVFRHATGDNNQIMHIIQIIGEGKIESLEELYLDDELIATYGDNASYVFLPGGGGDQYICTQLLAEFPEWDDVMRHTAYIYVKLTYDPGKFKSYPNIVCKVKGLQLYDPRTSTTAWSNNPALVIYDLFTNARGINHYGKIMSKDYWDEDSIKTAANWYDSEGMEINCAIAQQASALDVAQMLLNSCRSILVWSDGLFKLVPLDWDASVMTLTEDDIKKDSASFSIPSVTNLVNTVKIKFHNADNNYLEEEIVLKNTSAISTDGEDREVSMTMMDTDYERACKIAAYFLNRYRLNTLYNLTVGPKAIPLEPGDVITVTHQLLGWDEQICRVQSVTLLPNYEIALNVLIDNEDLYDDTVNIATHNTYSVTLPSPLDIPPEVTNVTFSESLSVIKDNTYTELKVTWDDPANYYYLDHVEVWICDTEEGTYVCAGQYKDSFIFTFGDEGATWWFKLRPVSIYSIRRPLETTTAYDHTIIGKTAPPGDVSSISALLTNNTVNLSWSAVSQTDLYMYELRFGGYWASSLLLGRTKSEFWSQASVKPGYHVFTVKALDSLGQYSVNDAHTVCEVFYPEGYVEKHSYSNDFTSGTHNNTERIIDPIFGVVLAVDHTGGLSGTYTSPTYDMGSIKTCRHWLDFNTYSNSTWDSVMRTGETWLDHFIYGEDWKHFFSKVAYGTIDITLYYSVDNINWHSAAKFEILSMEVIARYIKYVISITDDDETKYIYVGPCTEQAYYYE